MQTFSFFWYDWLDEGIESKSIDYEADTPTTILMSHCQYSYESIRNICTCLSPFATLF